MIYSSLKGGLGNMMFEIAAMASLAYDNSDEFRFINVTGQKNYLNAETNFNPNMTHANEYGFLIDCFYENRTDFTKHFNIPFEYVKLEYVNNAFYDGFFQSEKWFAHNRSVVLDILKHSDEIHKYIVLNYSHLLYDDRTVSVHVRRGDYVNNQNNHSLLSEQYYIKAFEHYDKESVFVFFSDDIEYCKNTFFNKNQVFINDKDYIEVYLMSMLSNHIIANSSFSWWGAWLNNKEDKKVIAPNIWFGPNIKHDASHIIPISWIQI